MNEYDVKRLALILSVQAEIEGMKAQNAIQAIRNEYPTYNEGDFQAKAGRLENIAYAHDQQLF